MIQITKILIKLFKLICTEHISNYFLTQIIYVICLKQLQWNNLYVNTIETHIEEILDSIW